VRPRFRRRRIGLKGLTVGAAVIAATVVPLPAPPASGTPGPSSVTVAGSLQSELGCPDDWQPDCAITHLSYDPHDDVWQGTWTVPPGNWEYKAALNDSWDENYGLHAEPYGPNIPLELGAPTSVTFLYDHKTHWITDDHNSLIVTAPGNYQSALGCSSNWDPTCLRSWLEDPNGDGVFTFSTTSIPRGTYHAKAAIGRSRSDSYGVGGVLGGAAITFTVPFDGADVVFRYDAASRRLSITTRHAHDDYVEYPGLRFDSRDTLYRTPAGAVPAGTPVTLRFRTYHDDVTGVQVRVYDTNTSSQRFLTMRRIAAGVSCYQARLRHDTCDFWQATLPNPRPDVLWFRFIVRDGTAVAYYADDTTALDGGLGVASPDEIDYSYALTVYRSEERRVGKECRSRWSPYH